MIIKISKNTRMVYLEKTFIGNDGENLQDNLDFIFIDEFVNGTARLEYINDENKNYIMLDKIDEKYTMPIKNVLTKEGSILMQLVITEGIEDTEIAVFKSNEFRLRVDASINAITEAPEGYELWIEKANAKLNEIDKAVADTHDLLNEVQQKLDDGEFDAKINGYNTIEIIAGENVTLEQEENILKLNSKMYDDTDIKTHITSLEEIVEEHDKDITNIDNEITTLQEENEEMLENINHLADTKADKTEIPDVSQFVTKGVNDLVNYYLKTDTYTKTEVNEIVGAIKTISMKIVTERPENPQTNIIYLIPSAKQEPENIYDEYIYIDNKWELIGSTQIDLSDYVKNTDYATTSKGGTIKIGGYGSDVINGILRANVYLSSNYPNVNQNSFISKGTLENIIYDYVKRGLVNNNITLTDEEKLKIETWLGLAENYLTYYNETPYQVEGQYNPTHKKYVDEKIKVLDDKVKELELFKFPNMTIVGTPTIQNGQVSDFTLDDYLEFPFLVDFRGRPFEINFAFTTGSNVTVQQNILDSAFGLAFAIKNGKTLMAISYNGTTWSNQYEGTLNIEPNTTYVYKITWNGMLYKVQYFNGAEYVNDFYFTATQQPFPKQMFIGVSNLSNNYFEGSINLNYANLKVDGNVVWSGMDDARTCFENGSRYV